MKTPFKSVPLKQFYRLINHGPCVVVTTASGKSKNAAPIAWAMPVNDEPPLAAISVADTHFTAELIKKSGEFAINVANEAILKEMLFCGSVSGRKTDKIKKSGLSVIKGKKIKVPVLKDCAGYLECRVIDSIEYGGVTVFVGKVLYAAAKRGAFDSCWVPEKAKTVHHIGGKFFAFTGSRFQSE